MTFIERHLFTLFWVVVAVTIIGLPIPPAIRAKSWKRFFLSMLLSAVGILFPLFIFTMSAFMIPEWKGSCRCGWFDCFHVGKLALTPLALWPIASFYVVAILRLTPRNRTWTTLGLFLGSIMSITCLVFGIAVHASFDMAETLWLLVPLYVAVWFSILSIRATKDSKLGIVPYVITLLTSVPFWIWSIVWSKKEYLALPDQAPECFVVTAALRGHEGVVGPFSTTEHHKILRKTNSQLRTFWEFENLWAMNASSTHRIFRRLYNRIGPHIARRIRTRFLADIVYLALKPVEAIATFSLYIHALTTKPKRR